MLQRSICGYLSKEWKDLEKNKGKKTWNRTVFKNIGEENSKTKSQVFRLGRTQGEPDKVNHKDWA